MSVVPDYTNGNNFTYGDYLQLEGDKRCEVINGTIYMLSSPSRQHQQYAGFVYRQISEYIEKSKKSCETYIAPFDVILLDEPDSTNIESIEKASNVVQPDVFIVCEPYDIEDSKRRIKDAGCFGAPDLVVEVVSPSSVTRDYHQKRGLYRHYGVKEYWIINPLDDTIIVYDFRNGEKSQVYNIKDLVKSIFIDGLEVDFSML